jgi:membrane fusion protein (multidrug efflux system)
VVVLGGDGKVAQRRVQADTMSGTDWIVTGGLADGDEVIVSGVDKVRPGMSARAVPQAATTGTAAPSTVARELQ